VKWLTEQEKMRGWTWFNPSGIDWIIVVCYCCDLLWSQVCLFNVLNEVLCQLCDHKKVSVTQSFRNNVIWWSRHISY